MKRHTLAALAALALATAAPVAANAGTIVYNTYAGLAGDQAWEGTLGLDFRVNSAISVDALGVFDDSSNGLERNISVTIYNASGVAVTPIISFLTGGGTGLAYLFQSIAPVVLTPGAYQLAAWGYGQGELNYNNDGPNGPITFNDLGGRLTALGTRYSGVAGGLATLPDQGLTRYGAGSFQAAAVPEPATWAMMITGFGAAGVMMRRRRGAGALPA